MPNIDPPDQTQVKGTIKSAVQVRVVAPAVNPSGSGWYQVPCGGEFRSTEANELPLKEIPPMISERRKVFPQARQRATSVETLMSSVAIFGAAGRTVDLHECGNYAMNGNRQAVTRTGRPDAKSD